VVPAPFRALTAAIFMRAVRDALGVDWRPVSRKDAESAKVFLRSPWAADLALALELDAEALAAWVERVLADPAALESAKPVVERFRTWA